MLEKRNKLLSLLLLLLASATAAIYSVTRRQDTYAVDKGIFKQFDLEGINEIILLSPTGEVVLKYTGSRWRVNDQFAADPAMIDVLFATLQQAEPRRPLAASTQDSVGKSIQQYGVKITLLSSGTVQKSFFAGGNAAKREAYFLDAETGISYLMTIPGYRVYVSGIFELPGSGWRDKFVFGFNWRNFQGLDSKFSRQPASDFKVAMEDNYFSIPGLMQVDTTKLNDFLDRVSLLTVSEYIPATPHLDSLASAGSQVTILVTDVAHKEYRLDVYAPGDNDGQYFGQIDHSQWATFKRQSISEITRPRSFFIK